MDMLKVTVEQREEAARASVAAAEKWRGEGSVPHELACLRTALTAYLSYAVSRFRSPDEGIAYLAAVPVDPLLHRVDALNDTLYTSLREKGRPAEGSVANTITLVHLAWLLSEWELAERMIGIAVDPLVQKFSPLTPFWAEYARAQQQLVSRRRYKQAAPRVRGYERNWLPYLNLIEELTHGRSTETARAEIRTTFSRRNRDPKLIDPEMIDGDGVFPVRWDFREVSITRFWDCGGAPHCSA